MPIYLGATEQHMANGAAHLSQTSLPIGGENTNCVIAGHRGYNGASYFRYIDKLNVGDLVSVTNLWETLTYRVCEIKIIDPHDVTEILIQPRRELLTLLTCHPTLPGESSGMWFTVSVWNPPQSQFPDRSEVTQWILSGTA